MPLTKFQSEVAKLLAPNRSEDSHLAGGAALHLEPNSTRYSNDLDYFNDSEARVLEAFEIDRKSLEQEKLSLDLLLNRPGYIRALVTKDTESTLVEWAHDSAYRFLPVVKRVETGFQLHPIDLAVNKVLTLAGRDEARDYLDVLWANENILSLGALCWAAVGKDPGFTPKGLLDLIRRRGKYRPEDFAKLRLTSQPDLAELKEKWLDALSKAQLFISSRPPSELGCLYYSTKESRFVDPSTHVAEDIIPHYGRPGGVLPSVVE